MKSFRLLAAVLLLTAIAAGTVGPGHWTWLWWYPEIPLPDQSDHEYLTFNNGAHAVAMTKYTDNQVEKAWLTIVSNDAEGRRAESREFSNFLAGYQDICTIAQGSEYINVCVSAADNGVGRKFATFCDDGSDDDYVYAAATDLTAVPHPWPNFQCLSGEEQWNADMSSAVVAESPNYACAVFPVGYESGDDDYEGLIVKITTDGGVSWVHSTYIVTPYVDGPEQANPSICKGAGVYLHLAYCSAPGGANHDTIIYRRGDWTGLHWGDPPVVLDHASGASEPCIATDGDLVFVCWTKEWPQESRIYYTWSTDAGSTWPNGVNEFQLTYSDGDGPIKYWHPNTSVLMTGGKRSLLMTCAARKERSWPIESQSFVASAFGRYYDTYTPPVWIWQRYPLFSATTGSDVCYCPSVATLGPWGDNQVPQGICIWSKPTGVDYERSLQCSPGYWGYVIDRGVACWGANPGRRVIVDVDGNVHFASVMGSYVIGGPVSGALTPVMVGIGSQPALAVDGRGRRWVAYLWNDTLFCNVADDVIKPVFCGSSSAMPGQPSIACYPTASGYEVANVVFAVYDTAGSASKIMYARVDTSGAVVLDTIESVANLGDSLPCINVYKSDTLLVTWQHCDSVLAASLVEYGPWTQGQPGAWSSPSLLAAHGYHPMNVVEGNSLNCVWTEEPGQDTFVARRASSDVSEDLLSIWTDETSSGDSTTDTLDGVVYAGCGVLAWQQRINGKWVIRGKVRGDTMTFVSSDSGAYHPHAVAESSAINPSTDRVRVHLLWTEGVIFEVDSGVYDTGVTRYTVKDYDVSNSANAATRYNNGSKLLNKAGTDSLLAVYEDADGSVVYAQSADGDSWQREVVVEDRDWPAIAEDSSGKRWVVVHKVSPLTGTQTQEAYYRNGSSWTGPQTLYTSPQNGTLGPAGLAGSSYTTSGIAYTAFLTTLGPIKSVVLAKFNGSVVAACTLATGMSLGDPTLAVEPYSQDSDHVHVSWADAGVIKYRMNTDGRSSSIAANWTSTVTLSNAMVTANHPCIAADRDQIVVAWAQGATTEIYCRKRSTGSAYNVWEAAANLSNTNNPSDYPTIAMGDTVIVAWEEQRTMTDHDVLVSINFGDTVNIADNATMSNYPHVLFQNKTSGDTTIPYLHTVWSETPEVNVYEVGYNKLNLKQTGEGEQSAGRTPLPMKPALNACRPNPFRDRTQISYQLPSAGNVSLRIYDVSGRTVRTLQNGFQKPGAYSVNWDSKDSRGRLVPHGVYFYRLDTKGFRDVKKAVVTR